MSYEALFTSVFPYSSFQNRFEYSCSAFNHVRLRLYCQYGVVYDLDRLVEVASLAPQLLVYIVLGCLLLGDMYENDLNKRTIRRIVVLCMYDNDNHLLIVDSCIT